MTEQLLATLGYSGGRALLHVPGRATLESGVRWLLSKLTGQKVTVVTNQRMNLGSDHFYQTAQLNQTLLNIILENEILVIEASAGLGEFVVPRENGRIVVLSSDFKSLDELSETARFLSGQSIRFGPLDLTRFLGEIGYLYNSLTNPGSFTYQGIPQQIPMTGLQYQEYLVRLNRELSLGRRESFSALQQANFLYPPELQALHNLPRAERPDLPLDLPEEEGGWLNSAILNELRARSPKLYWLVQYLRLNPGKHIIWSSFTESNGIKLISSILQFAGFRTLTVTGTDPVKTRYEKAEEFNRLSNGIYLSNLSPVLDFNRVSSLIFFEQHPYDTFFQRYLRAVATNQSDFTIIFLIATGPYGEVTVDVTNYRLMSEMILTQKTILEILKTGRISLSDLEQYRAAFRIPTLTIQELQYSLPRTFVPVQ